MKTKINQKPLPVGQIRVDCIFTFTYVWSQKYQEFRFYDIGFPILWIQALYYRAHLEEAWKMKSSSQAISARLYRNCPRKNPFLSAAAKNKRKIVKIVICLLDVWPNLSRLELNASGHRRERSEGDCVDLSLPWLGTLGHLRWHHFNHMKAREDVEITGKWG